MVKNVNWVLEDDTLLTYETESGKGEILFSDIVPYWKDAAAEELEGATAKCYDDILLIMLLVADRQGGVIVGWNAAEGKVEHTSEADYAFAMDLDDGSVYSLIFVENMAAAPKAFIEKAVYGSINAETEEVKDIDMSIFDDFDGDIDKIHLSVEDGKMTVVVGDKEYQV